MDRNVQGKYQLLITKICNGEKLSDNERDWLFAHPSLARKLISNEFAALGENWADHPMFEGTKVKAGIERIKRETYGFLAEHGYVFDPEKHLYRCENHNDKRIALFAHQGFGLAFLGTLSLIIVSRNSSHEIPFGPLLSLGSLITMLLKMKILFTDCI